MILYISLISSCASTRKSSRSSRVSAYSVTNIRDVKKFIENFDMKVVYDKNNTDSFIINDYNLKITKLIIAKNNVCNDAIVFVMGEMKNKDKIRFLYLALNGEKTSAIKLDGSPENAGVVTVFLTNSDECCRLDTKGRNVVLNSTDEWTAVLVDIRSKIKSSICSTIAWKLDIPPIFDEPINPKQFDLFDYKLQFFDYMNSKNWEK